MWDQITDWEVVVPILPVVTVEGQVVWLRRCQMRMLKERGGYRRSRQFRVLPVSDIWINEHRKEPQP